MPAIFIFVVFSICLVNPYIMFTFVKQNENKKCPLLPTYKLKLTPFAWIIILPLCNVDSKRQ